MGQLQRIALFFCTAAAMMAAPAANAYTPTITPKGASVHWPAPHKFNLAGNPLNKSGLNPSEFRAAVVRSLQRWTVASGNVLHFDYWQGMDPRVYFTNSDYNGRSSIYFASQGAANTQLSSNVLGLTQVWYNTDNGDILEADVVLNDKDFRFTMNPKDSSGYGAGGTSFSSGRTGVFIDNVLTHELGHAFGLSHSGHLQSTMLFMESPEQAHLGCDELVAVRALYPAGDADSRGGITGQVTTDSGAPIFGAHVLAISRRRGVVLASALTDKQGKYVIGALEPGDYFLMAEPFLAGSQALPSFYSSMKLNICPNDEPFSRSFLMSGGGTLRSINVPTAGGMAQAPSIAVQCSNGGGAAVSGDLASSALSTAPIIFDGRGNGFGVADRFTYSNSAYYKLKGIVGHLEIHAMSYTLYSPVAPAMSLLDSNGNEVSVNISDRVYEGDSGYVNHDSSLSADSLAGDYVLKVTASSMNANQYPAGPVLLDTVHFLTITGSLNESQPSLAFSIPVNGRCRMSESFPEYASPAGDPPVADRGDDSKGVGFCGTVSTSGNGPSSGAGPDAGAIVGWLLPWMMMALVARLAKLLARRPISA